MPAPNDTAQAAPRGVPPLTRSQLHALVREWSLMLKGEGLPPERVLVVVKRFLHEAMAPAVARSSRADVLDFRVDALLADASQWCIEAYFDSGSDSTARGTSPNETPGDAIERRS